MQAPLTDIEDKKTLKYGTQCTSVSLVKIIVSFSTLLEIVSGMSLLHLYSSFFSGKLTKFPLQCHGSEATLQECPKRIVHGQKGLFAQNHPFSPLGEGAYSCADEGRNKAGVVCGSRSAIKALTGQDLGGHEIPCPKGELASLAREAVAKTMVKASTANIEGDLNWSSYITDVHRAVAKSGQLVTTVAALPWRLDLNDDSHGIQGGRMRTYILDSKHKISSKGRSRGVNQYRLGLREDETPAVTSSKNLKLKGATHVSNGELDLAANSGEDPLYLIDVTDELLQLLRAHLEGFGKGMAKVEGNSQEIRSAITSELLAGTEFLSKADETETTSDGSELAKLQDRLDKASQLITEASQSSLEEVDKVGDSLTEVKENSEALAQKLLAFKRKARCTLGNCVLYRYSADGMGFRCSAKCDDKSALMDTIDFADKTVGINMC